MTTQQPVAPVLPVYDFSKIVIEFKSGGNFDVLKQLVP
jgi:hypothetical protein